MERAGTAPGLSSYSGSSSLHNYCDDEKLRRGECVERTRTSYPPLTEDQKLEARRYILVMGLGIRTVARAMRVNFKAIRNYRDSLKAEGILKAEALVRKSQ